MKRTVILIVAGACALAGCGAGHRRVTWRSDGAAPAASRHAGGGAAGADAPLVHRSQVIGRSVRGRAIRLVESGDPARARSVLVVGCIHGTERAGVAITRRLIGMAPTASAHLWIINYLNPDGAARRTRVNAHGVDLNRNFPSHWRPIGVPGDLEYSGPRPASESETRIAMRLIERIRPSVTVWFHQPVDIVRAFGPSIPAGLQFAHLVKLPFRVIPWPAGSATNWQNHHFRGAAAFVVELPPGRLSKAAVGRYARALIKLAG